MADRYWVGGTGTWDSSTTTNWSTTSGGSGGASAPTNADNAIFDANSGTSAIVSVDATAVSSSTTVNKSDITLSLTGSPTLCVVGGTLTLTAGTIALNSYTLSTGLFSSNNSNTRSLDFGTGQLTVNGNGTTVYIANTLTGMTYAGSKTVNFAYAGAVGTRTLNNGGTAGASETNAINVNVTAGSDIFSCGAGSAVNNLTYTSGFTGTWAAPNNTFYGDITVVPGMSVGSGTNTLTYAGTGTQKITSSGKTFDFPVVQNGIGGTVQFQDNYTTGAGRLYTLTNGTIDLKNNALTVGAFASSNSNTRAILFGTGSINCAINNFSPWGMATATGFTYTGTPTVNITYAGSVGTRTIAMNATESQALNFNISAGTDTITTTNFSAKNLNFTGFAGTLSNSARTIFGNLTISSGMTLTAGANATTFAATSGTQQITTNGKTLDFPVTQNSPGATLQLQDNLTMGSTRTFTLAAGTLDLTGNSGNWTLSTGLLSSGAATTRAINFGTSGKITLTGNGATILNIGVFTGLTISGTSLIEATYSGATGTRRMDIGAGGEANAINVSITAGTDIIDLRTTNGSYRNLNFTGFSGSFSLSASLFVFGDLTISSGMTVNSSAAVMTFGKTSGAQQIITNGKTLGFPLTFNGIGGTFAFQDALTQGAARAFTIINGTVQLKNGVTSTVGVFATSGTNQKFLQSTLAGSQATLSQTSGTVNASYLTIQDINATGGATWNAFTTNNNVNAGNNLGWDFSSQLGKYIYTRRKNKRILP